MDLENIESTGKLKSFKKIEDTIQPSDDITSEKTTDKNRQGLIRTVKNAHLVYKRENDTDRYNELWIYKTKLDGIYYDIDVKNDILSGTDIPINQIRSEDNEQYYEIWNCGDVVFLKVFNLVN